MQVDAMAPAVFLLYNPGSPAAVPAATGVLVEPDGTQVPVPVSGCGPEGCGLGEIPLSTAEGTFYLSFYGTGFAGAAANDVTCTIGGVQVPVVYAGRQATPGVDQINIRLIPEVLHGLYEPELGPNLPTVIIRAGGVPVNSFQIYVY